MNLKKQKQKNDESLFELTGDELKRQRKAQKAELAQQLENLDNMDDIVNAVKIGDGKKKRRHEVKEAVKKLADQAE